MAVLVVDDTDVNRAILAAILRKAGLRAVLAPGGEEALRLARAERPDLILLDVMMPGLDGFQVMEALQRDPLLSPVPVIFLTSKGETRDKVRGLSLGAADWVTKPFDAEEVLARVQSQLRLRELSASLERANRELRRKQDQLDLDLRAAADIQQALLPRGGLHLPHLSGAALFLPAQVVGGDLYQVQELDAARACAWMLDVSGHGVPSAMVTVSVAQTMMTLRQLEPARVLARLEAEYPFERFERFFTIAYLLFDAAQRTARVGCAGHPAPVLIRARALRELGKGGSVIGMGQAAFEEEVVRLEDGDRIAIYTDGVIELENAAEEQFGPTRLFQALALGSEAPLGEAVARLSAALRAHAGDVPPRDDVTLLMLEWRGRA